MAAGAHGRVAGLAGAGGLALVRREGIDEGDVEPEVGRVGGHAADVLEALAGEVGLRGDGAGHEACEEGGARHRCRGPRAMMEGGPRAMVEGMKGETELWPMR